MRGRWTVMAAAWAVVAVLTMLGGLTAVNLVGGEFLGAGSGQQPLTDAEVDRQLAAPAPVESTRTSESPPATASATPREPVASSASQATSRVLPTDGGTVVAVCAGGRVRLRSWTPAQGFRVDDVAPGPARHASVKFESGEDEVRVVVTCVGDRPEAQVRHDD